MNDSAWNVNRNRRKLIFTIINILGGGIQRHKVTFDKSAPILIMVREYSFSLYICWKYSVSLKLSIKHSRWIYIKHKNQYVSSNLFKRHMCKATHGNASYRVRRRWECMGELYQRRPIKYQMNRFLFFAWLLINVKLDYRHLSIL